MTTLSARAGATFGVTTRHVVVSALATTAQKQVVVVAVVVVDVMSAGGPGRGVGRSVGSAIARCSATTNFNA